MSTIVLGCDWHQRYSVGIAWREAFAISTSRQQQPPTSDHGPISGVVVVDIKKIDETRRQVMKQQAKEGRYKVQEKEMWM